MSYSHVIIAENALATIRQETGKANNTETGGALVGYLTPENFLIVTNACGPGPRSQLKRTTVLIDGQYADRFCTDLYHKSGGRLDYVGDWHRHPDWSSLSPSEHDRNAMLTVKEAGCCAIPYPISAIYRSRPEKLVMYALQNKTFKKIGVTIITAAVP